MSPLRIAVIGAGVIGKTHIDALAQLPDARLAAIADPSAEAGALAARHGVPHHADYRALLEAGRPDGVIVATPNATHVPIGLACVERGIPVLIEKPIADTVEDAQRLTAAAERAGVPLLVGHHRRHNPILQTAREVIGRGDLGALVSATILYTFLKPDGYFDVAWRKQEGGGPILINLIHEIDTLRFLCGGIESLQAMRSSKTRGFPVEDTAAVVLRMRSGALATISLSDAAATPWSWDMTTGESPQFARQSVPTHFFSGTDGSLAVPTLELWRYEGGRGWLDPFTRTALPLRPANPYVRQLDHFARVIRGEEEPLVGGADATETLRATLAVREATDSGGPIRFDA
ncbi:Gfo/Idh/MocA family protein [Azospirillum agricola]|uniref:Gfo/Idh/MocA family protein n=1 Tax=Azospirillum agricola TaxID=1720247 RepID=UPI000A0F236D|nr:Gfo/Idh/MocA family oxidoreductase [Azospirillum agricola]SMH33167.1 Predicted dehydrogenase [Azospirillum lipoferum]